MLKSLILAALVGAVYFLGKQSLDSLIQRLGKDKEVSPTRIHYIKKTMTILWTLLAALALGLVVGLGYQEVGLIFGSIFAVLGVALFAQWSILSNITASVIVFFFFPYRVGDRVRVIDGENSIQGVIKEITLFHVILEEDNELVTYPNALVFQKAVKIQRKLPSPERVSEKTEAP